MKALELIPKPTPEQVDALIGEYQMVDEAVAEAERQRTELEKQLVSLVRAHGVRPDNATQSFKLQGVHSEALVTLGVTRSLIEPNVGKLREYMKAQSLVHLFRRMFAESEKFTLIDGAHDLLNGVELPKTTRKKVLEYFGACIAMKDQKPKLKVKAVKPVAPKRSRGGKAAA